MYIDVPIPDCWSYGATRTINERTIVITAASGKTERDQRWRYPLHNYSSPFTNRPESEIEELMYHYYAVAGRANTFPVKDPFDYKTSISANPISGNDQSLGVAQVGQTDFQCRKLYKLASIEQERKITRPIESTMIVWVDGVPQSYTMQPLGVIRFDAPLIGGEEVTWGGEFHVPCAYTSDDITQAVHNKGDEYISDVTLQLIEDKE